ncbi:MAG: hypothetical protein CMB99_01150 [Flavobacteriaceae bacterium]|nr:hypothetical protein [Flavobacteriaceae bacterium]
MPVRANPLALANEESGASKSGTSLLMGDRGLDDGMVGLLGRDVLPRPGDRADERSDEEDHDQELIVRGPIAGHASLHADYI